MTTITQACAAMVQAQNNVNHLAQVEAQMRREPAAVPPGLRISVDFAYWVQRDAFAGVVRFLASVPAANDMTTNLEHA